MSYLRRGKRDRDNECMSELITAMIIWLITSDSTVSFATSAPNWSNKA